MNLTPDRRDPDEQHVTNFWTDLTIASGLVATVLIVLALGGGLLFSARATGTRPRPNACARVALL